MDNYDKNQVDLDLMDKVEDILTGKTKYEEPPELVFSEEVPKDYDISMDLYAAEVNAETINAAEAAANADFTPEVEMPDASFNYNAPQAPDFGGFAAKEQQPVQQAAPQAGDPSQDSKATIGMIIGIIAMVLAVLGVALGALPIAVGLYCSLQGRKSTKPKRAMAGLIMNIIGAILLVLALIKVF